MTRMAIVQWNKAAMAPYRRCVFSIRIMIMQVCTRRNDRAIGSFLPASRSAQRFHVAAHCERLAGDVRPGAGCEEERHVGDVLRRDRGAQRHAPEELLPLRL